VSPKPTRKYHVKNLKTVLGLEVECLGAPDWRRAKLCGLENHSAESGGSLGRRALLCAGPAQADLGIAMGSDR
jgi:hypothetical protein